MAEEFTGLRDRAAMALQAELDGRMAARITVDAEQLATVLDLLRDIYVTYRKRPYSDFTTEQNRKWHDEMDAALRRLEEAGVPHGA